MSASTTSTFEIGGEVSPGLEPVRETFAENFLRRGELGGACCAYHRGEKIVDLWGGVRNKATGEPWEADTMVLVHSATKGAAGMTLALAHSRGWLDYDARVCEYWPEFAQQGKERITVRQLLAHQAALFAFDEPIDREVFADLDRLAVVLARQHDGVGAGRAAGLPRPQPRLLRERAAAPGRSGEPQPRAGLPGRDRHSARARLLHPPARVDPQRPLGGARRSERSSAAARVPARGHAGGAESPLGPAPVVDLQPCRAAALRRAADLCEKPRSPVRGRRRQRPCDRPRLSPP